MLFLYVNLIRTEFLLKFVNSFTQVDDQFALGIMIDYRFVFYAFSPLRKSECIDSLPHQPGACTYTGDHQSATVASNGVGQQFGQFRVVERDVQSCFG